MYPFNVSFLLWIFATGSFAIAGYYFECWSVKICLNGWISIVYSASK